MVKSNKKMNRCDIMKYKNIIEGTFISRPNRFIAKVEIDNKEQTVHVKNTGRCRELLIPGAKVFLEESDNPNRKTKYDLITVSKNGRLINMDSQAPNAVFKEYLENGFLFENTSLIKPEYKFGNSRVDFYVECENRKILIEVKGVTLEKDNVVLFPDAPTLRGVKHIYELISAVKQGYEAYIVFIIQMSDVKYFTPNVNTHPEFAQGLFDAEKSGVKILAFDCNVTESTLDVKSTVEVRLNNSSKE